MKWLEKGCHWLKSFHYPDYPHSPQFSTDLRRFVNQPPNHPIHLLPTLRSLWQMWRYPQRFAPDFPLPMQSPNWHDFLADVPQTRMIWLGHSSLVMRIGQKTVLIDPVWADSVSPIPILMKRFQTSPVALAELPKVDIIVYSHNHYDHLDKQVVDYFTTHTTRFIVPLGMATLLQSWGIASERIQELDWWQQHTFPLFTIHAVPARHNTGRGLGDKNKTLWNGYVFQTQHEKIYFSGDSSYAKHFVEIGQRFDGVDLALMENGQYNPAWFDNHMFPEQTAQAVQDVGARAFMPMHWGAYPLSIHAWDEPVRQSIPLVRAAGIRILTPLQGQVFDCSSQTNEWWHQRTS